MSKKIGYKPVPTNKNIGGMTHGKFMSQAHGDHQKPGRKAPAGKEKMTHLSAEDFMKKTVAQMRKQGKRVNGRVAMADGGGAFH